MSDVVETVKVKTVSPQGVEGYKVINKSDFKKGEDELFVAKGGEDQENSPLANSDGKNPSGTFSEPTPTDIRYPNKDATEFENNHGAFVGKSAAEMREANGLEDAPGGIYPEVEVPNDWESMPRSERQELAHKLGGGANLQPSQANKFIRDAITAREAANRTGVSDRGAEDIKDEQKTKAAKAGGKSSRSTRAKAGAGKLKDDESESEDGKKGEDGKGGDAS